MLCAVVEVAKREGRRAWPGAAGHVLRAEETHGAGERERERRDGESRVLFSLGQSKAAAVCQPCAARLSREQVIKILR